MSSHSCESLSLQRARKHMKFVGPTLFPQRRITILHLFYIFRLLFISRNFHHAQKQREQPRGPQYQLPQLSVFSWCSEHTLFFLHFLHSYSSHIISSLDWLKSLNNIPFAHLPVYFPHKVKMVYNCKSDLATPVPKISYVLSFKNPEHLWSGELSDLYQFRCHLFFFFNLPHHPIKNVLPQSLQSLSQVQTSCFVFIMAFITI